MMLARKDLGEDAMKILSQANRFQIQNKNEEEIAALEEIVAVAISSSHTEVLSDRLLGAVGRIVQKVAAKEDDCVVTALKQDEMLKQDVATLFGKFTLSSGLALRASALFIFDVVNALMSSSEAGKI